MSTDNGNVEDASDLTAEDIEAAVAETASDPLADAPAHTALQMKQEPKANPVSVHQSEEPARRLEPFSDAELNATDPGDIEASLEESTSEAEFTKASVSVGNPANDALSAAIVENPRGLTGAEALANAINTTHSEEESYQDSIRTELLHDGLDRLAPFLIKTQDLDDSVDTIARFGDRTVSKGARRLQHQLRRIEPSITMIGQVKAGKTSLVNAMVGWPDLLPADVNPWTSVVTSLHVSPKGHPGGNHSSFRFFEEEEWSRLLDRGGRIGELAGRAGADEEVEKVRKQLEDMRQKSRRRLGDKFEMLLGQEHNYGYFDSDLIERYVCLGDDFETDTDTSSSQGRFADITKSADLFLQRSEFPMDLCIRDTPGVNDTFMMREQITIRAIRESRMCVVVLSAHQALSTVDLALIRLIANIPSREVVIFVNRIDELSDPTRQVPEIRESIRKTLKLHQGPEDAEIIFGSAYWANTALVGSIDDLDEASAASLVNWAESQMSSEKEDQPIENTIWQMSGVPALYATLATRIEDGIGQEVIDRVARNAKNLISSVKASNQIVSMRISENRIIPLDRKKISEELDQIQDRAFEALEAEFVDVIAGFHTRMDRGHKGFLDRATASLVQHLESYGELEIWQYDPTGLRVLLRSAYQVFARNAQKASQKVFVQTTAEIREIYLRAFDVPDASFGLESPPPPRIPSPVLLGQTIALDLKGSWWKRWWHKRRGYRSFAMDFAEIIKAETDPIVEGLKIEHVNSVKNEAAEILREFVATQRTSLANLSEQASQSLDEIIAAGESQETKDRNQALEMTLEALTKYAA